MLTQEEVREHLSYDPGTGELKWRKGRRGRKGNMDVGSSDGDGYIQLKIDRKVYKAHRIIWLWWYGYFPENQIDHIDRDRMNNRLSNLREVSHQCNMRNAGMDKRNSSGVKGVTRHELADKWQVCIRVANKTRYLGIYTCFVEAVAHRLAAEQCLGWEGCDSSSSAFRFMRPKQPRLSSV